MIRKYPAFLLIRFLRFTDWLRSSVFWVQPGSGRKWWCRPLASVDYPIHGGTELIIIDQPCSASVCSDVHVRDAVMDKIRLHFEASEVSVKWQLLNALTSVKSDARSNVQILTLLLDPRASSLGQECLTLNTFAKCLAVAGLSGSKLVGLT